MPSETAKVRSILAPYCIGDGLDIGYGGDPIVLHAICCDLKNRYANVGHHPQHLHGGAWELPFKDKSLNWVYSSHLIEDFAYSEQLLLLWEWQRVIRSGGSLILCAPDQRRYVEWCNANRQNSNEHHAESDFSLANFKSRVLSAMPFLKRECEWDSIVDYSWAIVLRKE